MRFASTLSSAAVMALASASDLALYWGQASGGNQQSLGDYCKNSAGDIYLISFINSFGSGRELSMEVNGYWNNLPGTQLPDAANTIGEDIKTCQSMGKKVLVSLGGASGNYGFNSDSDAQSVAQDLWNIFAGGQSSTRPFGDAKVDGFDLDIENNIDAPEYTPFVNKLRELYNTDSSKQYYMSAAPQCPFPDASVGDAVAHAQFDFLFIQFYNNYCSATGNNFNWDTWQQFATGQSPNHNVKLFLGLPGSQTAAGSGYATPDVVKQTVSKIGSTPNFGGIMLWDAAQANNNHVDGTTFAQEMKNILGDSSPAAPQSSSAPAPQTSSAPAPTTSSPAPGAWTPQAESSSTSSPAQAWAPASSHTHAPAGAPEGAPSSSSSPAQAWAPSHTHAPAWAPSSSAEAAAGTNAPQQATFTKDLQGGNGAVTMHETFTTTSSCSTSQTPAASSPNAAAAAPSSSPSENQPSSASSSEPVSSYPTSTGTRVTSKVGENGQNVWVTLHETFYTTECPSSAVANAGAVSPTSTVHSTSVIQKTLPGVTTTQTSYPAARTTSGGQHDFTSDGEVYIYDTVWSTAYTTMWVR